jgi:hypothetical protein
LSRIEVRMPGWWAVLGACSADPAVHGAYRDACAKAMPRFVVLAADVERIRLSVRSIHRRLIDDRHPAPGICVACWDSAFDDHVEWPCPTVRATDW